MTDLDNKDYIKFHKSFEEELKDRGRSNSTIIAYLKDIEQLLVFLNDKGSTNVNQIGTEDLEAFKKDLEANNYTPKSISRKINSIRTFFKFLTEKNLVGDNVAERLAHPKFDVKPPKVLTSLEYRALRDVARVDTRLYSIIELLLQTGIRIGELANLKLEDVKTSKENKVPYLYVREQGSQPARKVPLNKPAFAAINAYLKIRPECEEETLFVTKNGHPLLIRNIRTTIDKAFERAGIKGAKVNDLRNTFIAHHLNNGVSLVTVAKLVGHKRLSTTEKYLNLISDEKSDKQDDLKEL